MRSLILIWAGAAIAPGAPASSQTAAPQAVAPKPVSRADLVKTLDTQFGAVDANHDGSISKAELEAAELRGLQQRAQAQFKQLDTNHDGQLNFQEFAAGGLTQIVSQLSDRGLQQLDTDRDGKISADEFRAPQLASFAKVDANHDGTVTPAEIAAYKKAHPQTPAK